MNATRTIEPISEESFSQLKGMIAQLKKEVKYNDYHHMNNDEDTDFSNLNDPHIYGEGIVCNGLDNNLDVLIATNLRVVYVNDAIEVTYWDRDPESDASLTVSELVNVLQRLAKLGRTGIAKLEHTNGIKEDKINELKSSMDF